GVKLGKNGCPTSHPTCYRNRGEGPGTGRAGRLICKTVQASLDWGAYFAERTCRWERFRHANRQCSDGQRVQIAPTISRNVCLSSRNFPDDLLPLSLSAIQRCSPSFRQRCPVRQKRHLVLSGVHSPSIRPSIGTENPIPEEMDHREIAVRVPVMNEVQFLFASEPCKPLKPRSPYGVFLVEKDVGVERHRTGD